MAFNDIFGFLHLIYICFKNMSDTLGSITPIFECNTLDRFETPPCNIYDYNGNSIDVNTALW